MIINKGDGRKLNTDVSARTFHQVNKIPFTDSGRCKHCSPLPLPLLFPFRITPPPPPPPHTHTPFFTLLPSARIRFPPIRDMKILLFFVRVSTSCGFLVQLQNPASLTPTPTDEVNSHISPGSLLNVSHKISGGTNCRAVPWAEQHRVTASLLSTDFGRRANADSTWHCLPDRLHCLRGSFCIFMTRFSWLGVADWSAHCLLAARGWGFPVW